MEVTSVNYKAEYTQFMKMYSEAQDKFLSTQQVDNDLYAKCLEYSFRLTEYFNPLHPLKYADDHDIIKNLYYIRAEMLVRTVGIDIRKGSLTNKEKQLFHTVVALLRKCLSVDPLYLQAMELFKISVIYLTISNPNLDENISNLKQVLQVYPYDYQLQFNLGFTYQRKNDLDNAISAYKMAIGIIDLHNPKTDVLRNFKIKCLNGLGSIYHTVQDRSLAKYYFLQALEESPDDPDINNQLGVIHTELRNTDLAIKYYKHGIINFKNTHISTDLDMLVASMYMNMGLAMCYQCDFKSASDSYNMALKYKPRLSLAYQNKLLDLNYISHLIEDPMYVAKLHKNITKIYEKDISDYRVSLPNYSVKQFVIDTPTKNGLKGKGKINIGFVSGDFICHPVSYFISGILSNINYSIFTVTCYSGKLINVKGQYPNCKWVTIKGKSNTELSDLIKGDNIDILFDLSGHTGDNRLDTFVLKPAPIQISYCGYPGSSGIKAMDYRITDSIADSKKSEKYYREKLLYMPDCFLNYTPSIGTDLVPLPAKTPFEQNGYITFGCFNRFNKINDMVISVWEKILTSTDARLVIKTKEFTTGTIKQKFLDSFKDQSVLERVKILEYSDTYIDHLPDYNLMDVSLDTFPYSGTTTSCESLFMGVPVLTLFDNDRNYHSQNVTSSILANSDLEEYITYSQEDYISKAIELFSGFNHTKEFIRDKFLNGKVCKSQDFVDSFETTLVNAYKKHNWK